MRSQSTVSTVSEDKAGVGAGGGRDPSARAIAKSKVSASPLRERETARVASIKMERAVPFI